MSSEDTQPTVVVLAELALKSLITSCSGILIALLAFLGQSDELSATAKTLALASAGFAAGSLWLSLLTTSIAYLAEGWLVTRNYNGCFWIAAMVLYFMALAGLLTSLVTGGLFLAQL